MLEVVFDLEGPQVYLAFDNTKLPYCCVMLFIHSLPPEQIPSIT